MQQSFQILCRFFSNHFNDKSFLSILVIFVSMPLFLNTARERFVEKGEEEKVERNWANIVKIMQFQYTLKHKFFKKILIEIKENIFTELKL